MLPAAALLQIVQANKAIAEIRRQSRLSEQVWNRDLMPVLVKYAEFVQLAPASEAHHHAHVGGLLSHTVEMLLAAMHFRNGHLLPEGEQIEDIDAQRDEWTYVVFLCALLHDVAKPMTDLRIKWRASGMPDAIAWLPMTGSLADVSADRIGAEYHVEFTPKASRDYGSHGRLSMMLLPRIVPPSAMAFLARQPAAFEALNLYLSGKDDDSLVARIVKQADKASTQRALLIGSKARFSTATATPLIDMLMQAIGSMLRTGTQLPLNRSGAAGWVHNGSVWFVAKRLADAVRAWIQAHEPDAAMPGETKNDRLFDTWQEYGCIEVNPASGQSIWYVSVNGRAGDAGGTDAELASYSHTLSMLRFPLSKLFDEPSKYPKAFNGHIEVHAKRKAAAEQEGEDPPEAKFTGARSPDAVTDSATLPQPSPPEASPPAPPEKVKPRQEQTQLKAPAFNKPKTKPATSPTALASTPPKDKGARSVPSRPSALSALNNADLDLSDIDMDVHGEDVPGAGRASYLDELDDVSAFGRKNASSPKKPAVSPNRPVSGASLVRVAPPTPRVKPNSATVANPTATPVAKPIASIAPLLAAPVQSFPHLVERSEAPTVHARSRGIHKDAVQERASTAAVAPSAVTSEPTNATPSPVILSQQSKRSGADALEPAPEPSALAVSFMKWLQEGLASRALKYSETGAAVHFVPEGMALVSPRIFKLYAEENDRADEADLAKTVQREVIKAGWHLKGPNRTNIISYNVLGRGGIVKGTLASVVLVNPERWVLPVPPNNVVLQMK